MIKSNKKKCSGYKNIGCMWGMSSCVHNNSYDRNFVAFHEIINIFIYINIYHIIIFV